MLVHPQFDPVAFHVGPLAVRWYGIMYLIGFILFIVLGRRRARAQMLTWWRPSDVDDMLFFGVFGVILGGRLGYVLFYKPLYYFAHPLEVFQVWHGGMSFHGGFLGVLIALWFFARRHRFRGAAVSARSRGGATRQFHQRRARRASHQRSVGDGVPAGRSASAAPVAAVRIRPRRRAALHHPLDLCIAASAARRDIGIVPDRL